MCGYISMTVLFLLAASPYVACQWSQAGLSCLITHGSTVSCLCCDVAKPLGKSTLISLGKQDIVWLCFCWEKKWQGAPKVDRCLESQTDSACLYLGIGWCEHSCRNGAICEAFKLHVSRRWTRPGKHASSAHGFEENLLHWRDEWIRSWMTEQ